MKKLIILLSIIFVISLIFCSCSLPGMYSNDTEKDTKPTLTDRQKKILKQLGLPQDYEKLDELYNEKLDELYDNSDADVDFPSISSSDIDSIEDMFKYLDRTYPKEKFEYVKYDQTTSPIPFFPAGTHDYLTVSSKYGEVEVEKYPHANPTYYSDNFKETKAGDVYATVIDDYLAKKYDRNSYVVDVSVGKYYGNTFSKKDVLEKCNCNGHINIYVNDKLGMKIFKSMSKELFNFLKNNTKNMQIYVNMKLIDSDKFTEDADELDNDSDNKLKKEINYSRDDYGEGKISEE